MLMLVNNYTRYKRDPRQWTDAMQAYIYKYVSAAYEAGIGRAMLGLIVQRLATLIMDSAPLIRGCSSL